MFELPFEPIRRFEKSFSHTEKDFGPTGRILERKRRVEYTGIIVQVMLRALGISSVCRVGEVREVSKKYGLQNFNQIIGTWFDTSILSLHSELFFPEKGGEVYFERARPFSLIPGSIGCISAKIQRIPGKSPSSPKGFEFYTPEVPNIFCLEPVGENQRFVPEDHWMFISGDVKVTHREWKDEPVSEYYFVGNPFDDFVG